MPKQPERCCKTTEIGLTSTKKAPLKQNVENVYGNAFEALIGAIYLDKGYKTAQQFINKNIIGNEAENINNIINSVTDYKSSLFEFCQAHKLKIEYALVSDEYSKKNDFHNFCFSVLIDDVIIAKANGKNKHDAQQNASKEALHILKENYTNI